MAQTRSSAVNGWWGSKFGGWLAGSIIGVTVLVGASQLACYLDGYCGADTKSRFAPHVPAGCSWKEIERDGDWQQTCDDNQTRLQR